MATITQTTPETEPTTDAHVTAQTTLDTARATVRTLEAALAAVPAQYTEAAKRANAGKMKELRHERLDYEEELHAAHIGVAHAEIAALNATFREVCARDREIAAEVEITRKVLANAHGAYEEARLANTAAESKVSSQEWEKTELRAQSLAAEARLKALITAPMPN